MIVENLNSQSNNTKLEYLAYAQTISNFFIEALDQNDCNVKIVVGFYQELDDAIESVKDLDEAFKPTTKLPEFEDIVRKPNPIIDKDQAIEKPLESEVITQAAIEALKEKCFRCHISMPKVNFHNDLQFSVNKVKGYIEVYKATFENPFKGNYCHLAYSMQYTCIPDLVKMLGMCMTAYAAVLALNKLPTFSLNAFIKGVIGSLLAEIVGSMSISLDASSTGLPCVLGILEELAYKVPSLEATDAAFDDTQKENWIQGYVSVENYRKKLDEDLEAGIITTQEEYDTYLDTYRRNFDPINHYKDKLEEKVGDAEEMVSNIFEQVNTLVGKAQEDINGYISAILGVVNFFECENKRSGPDFSEVMEYIQNLGNVINIFSALIAILVPKTMFWELCKDEQSYNELKDTMTETIQKPLSKTDLEEIIQEFTEHKAQISEDGLAVLIYDKPIKTRLPKLSLMGCNFKEFAEAHSLENIIKGSISDYLEEEERKKESIYREFENPDITLDRPGYRPREPVRVKPKEFDNTPETPTLTEDLELGIVIPDLIATVPSILVKDNSSYRDRVNEIVYDKFTPGIITGKPSITQLYEKYSNNGLIGNSYVTPITSEEYKWVFTNLDNIFKYHPYVKEDLLQGYPVFNDNYIPASSIYKHFQKISSLENTLNINNPYFNSIDFNTDAPEYDLTQDAYEYTFGNTVDLSKIENNLESTMLKDNIKYNVTQKVDISLEDIIGSKGQFDQILDDIMDFIYNDPTNEQGDKEPLDPNNSESDLDLHLFDNDRSLNYSITSNGDSRVEKNKVKFSDSIEVLQNSHYKGSNKDNFNPNASDILRKDFEYKIENNLNKEDEFNSFTDKIKKYTSKSDRTTQTNMHNQSECRSVEDVMNILKNIKT